MGNSNSLVQYEDFEGQNYLEIKTKYVRRLNYFLCDWMYVFIMDYFFCQNRHLGNNKLFKDEKFPTKSTSLQTSGSYNIEWIRATELAENPDFFVNGVSTNDVNQGKDFGY